MLLGHRCRVVACLLLLFWLSACTAQAAWPSSRYNEPPEWLLDLQQLLQEQPPVAAHLQALESPPANVAAAAQLLRPTSLPATAIAGDQVMVQQTGSPSHASISLASVSSTYGISPGHLRQMMQQDPGLLVSRSGLLVWTCLGQHAHASSSPADPGPHNTPVEEAAGADPADAGWLEGAPAAVTEAVAEVDPPGKASMLAVDDADMSPFQPSGLYTVLLPPRQAPDPAALPHTLQGWGPNEPAQPANLAALQGTAATLQASPGHSFTAGTAAAPVVHRQPGPQPPPQHAFVLHSRPAGSAQHTIFLDFRGCTISNTYWNTATSKPVLTTQAFDLDRDPSTFSVHEQEAIVSIWQAVAQDFAPWAVDVTTQDPGTDALVRSDAGDAHFGMHVCVGGSSATTVGGLSGGLAFTGAWGQLGPGLQPVLVFPEQLGNGHPRAVADSISHEVGHTFGLAHFGGSGSAPYNDGSGPWGPLLGLPYGRTLSQWSKGAAVSGAVQDDLQLIAQQLPALADDHGGDASSATPLCHQAAQAPDSQAPPVAKGSPAVRPAVSCKLLGPQAAPRGFSQGVEEVQMMKASVRGVISSNSDQDWFRVDAGQPGAMHVRLQLPSSAAGYGVNNLLAAAAITAPDGAQLAAVSPERGSELVLQVTAQLPAAGTYFVSVIPAGVPGVSSYGSLGDYALSVTFPTLPGSVQPSTAVMQEGPELATNQGCQQEHCAPCAGCGWCDGPGSQRCTCAGSRGLVAKPVSRATGSPGSPQSTAAAAGGASSCQYQEVTPLSFNPKACSAATAGAVVLLNFTISNPPACFEGGILAAAPQLELLHACPCRQSPRRAALHSLPVPPAGTAVPADGSYTCQDGVYSYGWQVPPSSAAGCYKLRVLLADGSSVVTVLRLVGAATTA